jgi:cyclomaltodextrinase / maltogenic alpha-amylase / neopullulanase
VLLQKSKSFSRVHRAVWRATFVFVLLQNAPLGATEPSIAFSTAGGDAWTSRKRFEINVLGGCERLAVSSPVQRQFAAPKNGRAAVELRLVPGANRITSECIKGPLRGHRAQQSWFVRLRDVPKTAISSHAERTKIVFDARETKLASGKRSQIARYEWRMHPENLESPEGFQAQGKRIRFSPPGTDGDYQIKLKAIDRAGRWDESTAVFRVKGQQFASVDLARHYPGWIETAVIYGIVPNLFGTRGLKDVTAQLDRLADLGVNVLWLSPVTASPANDFGYAVTDYFHLRPDFGSNEDLRELVSAAHQRKLRVIIDFVPNHLSDQHPYFIDTIKHAHASPYFSFFARNAAGEPAHYFEWRHLKNLNFSNAEVERMVIEAFAYWLREFDIDGFRVDAAWGPRERAPDLWPRWRAELKRIKPDIFLLAEAPASDLYYTAHGFDAAYDWTDKPGEWAWQAAFESNGKIAERLRWAIESPADSLRLRFLENNDTGPRFITRYGPNRTRVAAALLFTLPGIPALYTGQEIGAEFEPYKQSSPIGWQDEHGLEPYFRNLIRLRQKHVSLSSRLIDFVETGESGDVLGYIRKASNSEEQILVLLNFSDSVAEVPVSKYLRPTQNRELIDLLSGKPVVIDDSNQNISLTGHDVRILKIK